LRSQQGDVRGYGFILAEPSHAKGGQPHRIYLKQMLLTEQAYDLLPDWAFFVQCVVNSRTLKPTASREALYDDAELDATREELEECLRRYLVDLARDEPRRFQRLLNVHQLAIKALAAEDDECLLL